MLCNNKKNLFLLLFLFAASYCGAPEVIDNQNEFVQPKKQHKRISIATLKENNMQALWDVSVKSSSCVERLGRFQKNIPQGVNIVFKQDSRAYHEQTEQNLMQINDCLEQVEDLLRTCEKCIGTVIS